MKKNKNANTLKNKTRFGIKAASLAMGLLFATTLLPVGMTAFAVESQQESSPAVSQESQETISGLAQETTATQEPAPEVAENPVPVLPLIESASGTETQEMHAVQPVMDVETVPAAEQPEQTVAQSAAEYARVDFLDEEGKLLAQAEVEKGAALNDDQIPVIDQPEFAGWYEQSVAEKIEADRAAYRQAVEQALEAGQENPESLSELPPAVELEGYAAGLFDPSAAIQANLSLRAVYLEQEITGIAIAPMADLGPAVAEIQVADGDTLVFVSSVEFYLESDPDAHFAYDELTNVAVEADGAATLRIEGDGVQISALGGIGAIQVTLEGGKLAVKGQAGQTSVVWGENYLLKTGAELSIVSEDESATTPVSFGTLTVEEGALISVVTKALASSVTCDTVLLQGSMEVQGNTESEVMYVSNLLEVTGGSLSVTNLKDAGGSALKVLGANQNTRGPKFVLKEGASARLIASKEDPGNGVRMYSGLYATDVEVLDSSLFVQGYMAMNLAYDIQAVNADIQIESKFIGLNVQGESASFSNTQLTVTAGNYGLDLSSSADLDILNGSTVTIVAQQGLYTPQNINIDNSVVNIDAEQNGIYDAGIPGAALTIANNATVDIQGGTAAVWFTQDVPTLVTSGAQLNIHNRPGSQSFGLFSYGDLTVDNAQVNADTYNSAVYTAGDIVVQNHGEVSGASELTNCISTSGKIVVKENAVLRGKTGEYDAVLTYGGSIIAESGGQIYGTHTGANGSAVSANEDAIVRGAGSLIQGEAVGAVGVFVRFGDAIAENGGKILATSGAGNGIYMRDGSVRANTDGEIKAVSRDVAAIDAGGGVYAAPNGTLTAINESADYEAIFAVGDVAADGGSIWAQTIQWSSSVSAINVWGTVSATNAGTITEKYSVIQSFTKYEASVPFQDLGSIGDYTNYTYTADGRAIQKQTGGILFNQIPASGSLLTASRTGHQDAEPVVLSNGATHNIISGVVVGLGPAVLYTVTFDGNGADIQADPASKEVTGPDGPLGTLPVSPKRTGYEFIGWNLMADGSGGAVNAAYEVNGNITVYAQWEKLYTLSFEVNGGSGSIQPQQLKEGALAVQPTAPQRSGYTFKGWNTAADGKGTAWNFGSNRMPGDDLILYAVWEKVAPPASSSLPNSQSSSLPNSQSSSLPNSQSSSLPNSQSSSLPNSQSSSLPNSQSNSQPSPQPNSQSASQTSSQPRSNASSQARSLPASSAASSIPASSAAAVVSSAASSGESAVVSSQSGQPSGSSSVRTEEVNDNQVPLFGKSGGGYWSLLNLVLSIVGMLVTVMLFIEMAAGDKLHKKNGAQKNGKRATRKEYVNGTIAMLVGIMPAVLFLALEGINGKLVWLTGLSFVIVPVFVAHGVLVLLYAKNRKERSSTEENS